MTEPLSSSNVRHEKDRHEKGRGIYNFRCYFCHGYSGDAKTLAATYLTPRPRSFIATGIADLSREAMITAVTEGRAGTAMQGFANTITAEDIELVVDFVREEFMRNKAANTAYHTPENGWPNHRQYAPAFPFALGELAIDQPAAQLTPEQLLGRRIFMQSCVTCHDRGRVEDEGAIWDPRPVSYPRNQYSHRQDETPTAGENGGLSPGRGDDAKTDTVSSASPYARHETPPVLQNPTAAETEGEALFQKNCAFCHAPDGTGKNWIGSFLEPHPRNLTDPENMRDMSAERLREVIRNGLPNTTMSAWKSVLNEAQIDSLVAYIHKAFHPLKGIDVQRLDSGTAK
ncbi:MAG: c-type cytochrome [Gammaproteobacteria bacterium]|nr:c-type cytochrome [Gammaproteobacteria bacterium]